jgi:signal peptidase I
MEGGALAKAQKEQPAAPVARSRWEHLWGEWIKPLSLVGIVLLSFRSTFADWNDVPSGSMKPTILEGDRVFVNKLAYDLKVPFVTTGHHGRLNFFGLSVWDGGPAVPIVRWGDPRRGDVVVLWSPRDGKRLVKRVVAVPGDVLLVERQRLVVNGQPAAYAPVDADSLRLAGLSETPVELFAMEAVEGRMHVVMAESADTPRASFGPVSVPAGNYFVMGDHRSDSLDSRFFGMVERKRIVGRATAVVLSLDIKNGWRPRWRRFFSRLM